MMLAMVATLAVSAALDAPAAPAAPGGAKLAAAWHENAAYCKDDLGLKGPLARAVGQLERRGVSRAASRHLILACASPSDQPVAVASMRAALQAGPRLAVSIEIRKLLALLALRSRVLPEHHALAAELDEPERAFADALIDADPAPIGKLQAALAALPAGAPAAARDERRICLAAALADAGRTAEARETLPPAPAYPARRKAIVAQIAARSGDLTRVRQLVSEMKSSRGGEDIACERTVAAPECGVTRALIAAGRVDEARALDIEDCGALAAWAEAHLRPFDAYLALFESRGTRPDTVDDSLRAPRLLEKLGRADLALDRLESQARICARHDDDGNDQEIRSRSEICAASEKMRASLQQHAKPAPPADAALLARLRAPARWHEYQVLRAPPGKATGRKKQLAVPDGAEVVFSAVEGARAVAVALSRDVDPRGEVSAGGYVVYLSDDAGKSWRGPFHSGFAAGFPFFLRPASSAKVFDGDVLQLPVDVREVDPASISFPPVGLHALREQPNRLVRIPIALLEQDSDGDDLTDLLEERLGTDPNNPDTDGDGAPDAWDALPLEKSAAAAGTSDGRFAAAVLDQPKPQAVVHEPGSRTFHPEPRARPSSMATWPSLPTRFVAGAASLTDLPGRTIRLSPEAVQAYAKKLGPIYPIELEIIVDGRRAVVDIEESWRGATYLVEERPDGSFDVRTLESWVS